MDGVKSILRKAIDKELITIREYNEGIFVYIIYRIVWETKSHYILYAVDSEEDAKRIVAEFKSDEYFYQKVKVN
jgi:hypothetical protein